MWQHIKDFFSSNSTSIIVSLVVGSIFFILGPLGLWFSGKKVKKEKIKKAKEELLDLIENMLVNKEDTNIPKLITLFHAIERNNDVNLGIDSDLNNIFEDLILRFSKSKHLSAEQKDEYIKKIGDLINALHREEQKDVKKGAEIVRQEIPKSYKSIFDDLKEEANKIGSDVIQSNIELLEKKITRPSDPFLIMYRMIKEKPKLLITAFISYIFIIVIIYIISKLTPY